MAEHAHITRTPSPQVTTGTSRRRTLFAAASAVVMGVGITAGAAASVADYAPDLETPTRDDAQLIEMGAEGRVLCEEHMRLMARWWKFKANDPEIIRIADAAVVPHDRLCELADEAVKLRATTQAAWRAKAQLLRHHLLVECESEGGMEFTNYENELAWSLVCDLLAGA